jgi:hypothetical protein
MFPKSEERFADLFLYRFDADAQLFGDLAVL